MAQIWYWETRSKCGHVKIWWKWEITKMSKFSEIVPKLVLPQRTKSWFSYSICSRIVITDPKCISARCQTAALNWLSELTFSKACMELCNIILFTIAGFTLSYTRYGKPRNGYDVMQLHAHIWKGLLIFHSFHDMTNYSVCFLSYFIVFLLQ